MAVWEWGRVGVKGGARKSRNSKSEARNPKQFRMGESPKSETWDLEKVRTFKQEEGSKPHDQFRSLLFSNFGFVSNFVIRVSDLAPALDLLRISIFGFRI